MKNSTFFRYFKYEYKRKLKTLALMFTIGLLIYIIPLLNASDEKLRTTNVGIIITMLGFLCYIVPLIQNSYRMDKKVSYRNYSSPISRRSLLNVHYIIGLLNIISFYTITYFIGMLIVGITQEHFYINYYIPLYFVTLLVGICLYTINYFIVTKCNTSFDAIAILFLYMIVLTLFLSVIALLFKIDINSTDYFLITPLIQNGNYYNNLIVRGNTVIGIYPVRKYFVNKIMTFIILPVLAVASYVLMFIFAKNDNSETAEELTTSYFGYKIITPIVFGCYFSLTSTFSFSQNLIFVNIGIILYVVYCLLKYRKLKITKLDIIIFGIVLFIGYIIGLKIKANYEIVENTLEVFKWLN